MQVNQKFGIIESSGALQSNYTYEVLGFDSCRGKSTKEYKSFNYYQFGLCLYSQEWRDILYDLYPESKDFIKIKYID